MKVDVPLLRQVRRCLEQLGPDPGVIVVAVSGGPDSVALLHGLAACAGRVVAAHLNHQLRGSDSDDDEQFVHELCRTMGLELRTERCPVAAMAAAEGGNLEGVARRLRYDWLVRVARETGSRWIATGHTADDQAETVLHRLLRGAGLQGLRGIAPRRQAAPGIWIIRPLLAVPRAEVLSYLDGRHQTYRNDRSNLDLRFTRNRIRHELLPVLEGYNPAIAAVLARLAVQADEAWPELEGLARELLVRAERPRAGNILIFDRVELGTAAPHRVREMFRLLWAREGWPLGDMSFAAWERLEALCRSPGLGLDLPGGVRAECRERVVQVGHDYVRSV